MHLTDIACMDARCSAPAYLLQWKYVNLQLSFPMRWGRFYSSCTKFTPLSDTYKTLRHIHFPNITTFEEGQRIQDTIVRANLDFKLMEAKIKRQQKQLAAAGHEMSDYEKALVGKILDMKPHPTVLTFEFENVYTGGKKLKQDPDLPEKIAAFEQMGCSYHQLERGGDITWHGRGQMVAYTILDLKQFLNLLVKCYVDAVLLRATQDLLKNYGLESFTNENPGVWMSPHDDKIASVGCNIQRAITSYGIGLNVNPKMKYLNTFTMCGLPGKKAVSLQSLVQKEVLVEQIANEYAQQLAKALNIGSVEHLNGEELRKSLE